MSKKKIDFWMEISNEMNRDINEVKKKMDSLIASFGKRGNESPVAR